MIFEGVDKIYFIFAAIAFAYFFLLKRSRQPQIEINDLVYNKPLNQVELTVKNRGSSSCFIRPSVRIIHLLTPLEWKEQTENGNMPMMPGRAGSLIKGYDLIGEYDTPILVSGNKTEKIVYHLDDPLNIREFDNVRVDIPLGKQANLMDQILNGIIHIKIIDEIVDPSDDHKVVEEELHTIPLEDEIDQKILDIFEETPAPPHVEPPIEVLEETPPTQFDESPPTVEDEPEPLTPQTPYSERVKANNFPIDATCICCGQDKWLKWIVEDKHVCGECKDFLAEKIMEDYPEGISEDTEAAGDSDIKPRHSDILVLLKEYDSLTPCAVAEKLDRKKSAVSRDLRHLTKLGKVTREKKNKKFHYTINE